MKINENRTIFWEPDDHLHLLNKATSFKYCNPELNCNYKNLLSDKHVSDPTKLYKYERQIHRLLQFYHPLYTYLLSILSNFEDTFNSQKILHIFLGVIQALIVFFYISFFARNQFTLYFSIILVSVHHYFNSWGIYYPNPWSISVLIASITLTTNNRFCSYMLMIIAGMFHKIGILIYMLVLLTKIIYEYQNSNKRNLKSTLNIFKFELFISSLIFIFIYYFAYTPFQDMNNSIISAYEFDLNYRYFVSLIYENLIRLIKGIIFLICLNPILFVFFIYSLTIKIKDERLRKLKIFLIILILSSIFYFLPSGGKSFALGTRSWHLIAINYVVIAVSMIYLYEGKYRDILKYTFIVSLPFFLYWGFVLNYHYFILKMNKNNFFLKDDNVSKILNKIPDNKKIFFDTNETNFYFYMANGLIKKNFYFKSNYFDSLFEGIIVKDNPIKNIIRDSDFIVENGTVVSVKNNNNSLDKIYLKLFSKVDTNIKINDTNFKVVSGVNSILISSDENLSFKNISKPIYLIGLNINNKQNLQWPWGKDILLIIKTKEYLRKSLKNIPSYLLNFKIIDTYSNEQVFNFKYLPNFTDMCSVDNIISDLGSTILFDDSCINLK